MTPTLLQHVCEGYVRCYRTLNLHKASTWSDLTHRELAFFSHLGEMLGFRSRINHQHLDLSWSDTDTGDLVLYLERETERPRVLSETLRKLLTTPESVPAQHLVAILGWVSDSDLPQIAEMVSQELGQRSLLVVAWVGQKKASPDRIESYVYFPQKVIHRTAKPSLDDDGYWYAKFTTPWG